MIFYKKRTTVFVTVCLLISIACPNDAVVYANENATFVSENISYSEYFHKALTMQKKSNATTVLRQFFSSYEQKMLKSVATIHTVKTTEPTVSSEPAETIEPSVSPQPTKTAEPDASPQPTKTATPDISPQPIKTAEPEASPQPTETGEPDVSPKPTETAEPGVSPKPTETAEPNVSSQPIATPQPTETPSPVHTPQPTIKPEKGPFNLSIKKSGKDKLTLSWPKRSGAKNYKIWQKVNKQKKWHVIKKTDANKYKLTVKQGSYYRFKITASDKKGKSLGKTKRITVCIPASAYNMTYKRTATNKISVSWKKGRGTKKYIVMKKTDSGKYHEVDRIKKNSYNDVKIKVGKKYRYRIIPVYYNDDINISGTGTSLGITLRDEVSTSHQKYSYKELSRDLEALKKLYGNRISYEAIGQSHDGRNIYDVVIGNQNSGNTILVVAALHAREYMTSQLCMKQIEYYLQNYNEKIDGVKISQILNNVAIHYVPMSNPDGAAISQYGFSAIKNKKIRNKLYKMAGADTPSLWKANARGVDLNKNYPYEYVARDGRRGSENYTGTSKCSEPETQAIVKLINKLKKDSNVKGEINYHATGSIIFGSYEGKLKDTIDNMFELACEITGYANASDYSLGEGKSVGNLREFLMYKKNIPSITLEIGTVPCPLPAEQFNEIWKRNKTLVIKEAKLLTEGD